MNYLIKIEYDGRNYYGFQIQKQEKTIQEILQNSLFKLLNEEIVVNPSGRTDAKVSALFQTCNFHTEKKLDRYKFLRGINFYLPCDIAVKDIIEVDENFNARSSAKKKTYRYTILNSISHSPLNKNVYQTSYNINLDKMKEAAKLIEGEHNFKAFMKLGSSAKTYIRTIYKIDIIKEKDIIDIYITGSGFLYNMVRIIVGTLLEIAISKKDISVITKAFETHDRNLLGKTLPAEGLCLYNIVYSKEINEKWNKQQ